VQQVAEFAAGSALSVDTRCVRAGGYGGPVRGDRVEIVIDAGDEVRVYDIVATRNGRRVEINTGRGIVEVVEVTRSGTPVRTARFMSNRILALVEHPAETPNIARDIPPVHDEQGS
jgi:hypothetical protein